MIYQDFFDINSSILEFITNLPKLKLIKLLPSQATIITQDYLDLCRLQSIELSFMSYHDIPLNCCFPTPEIRNKMKAFYM